MIDTTRLELLLRTASDMGLKPEVVADRGLVSLEINSIPRYVFHKASNPNDQMASWISGNKYATRVIMDRSGLPNIPYCLPEDDLQAQKFLTLHRRIVAKPVRGQKSKDIHLITDIDHTKLAQLETGKYILEKFVKGQEVRLLVVCGVVLAVHHKKYLTEINNPNAVRRVSLEKSAWPKDLLPVAIAAAGAIGLRFSAVDFLVSDDGQHYVLEINSAPGIDRFQQPDEGPAIDAMRLYLEQLVKNYQ